MISCMISHAKYDIMYHIGQHDDKAYDIVCINDIVYDIIPLNMISYMISYMHDILSYSGLCMIIYMMCYI